MNPTATRTSHDRTLKEAGYRRHDNHYNGHAQAQAHVVEDLKQNSNSHSSSSSSRPNSSRPNSSGSGSFQDWLRETHNNDNNNNNTTTTTNGNTNANANANGSIGSITGKMSEETDDEPEHEHEHELPEQESSESSAADLLKTAMAHQEMGNRMENEGRYEEAVE